MENADDPKALSAAVARWLAHKNAASGARELAEAYSAESMTTRTIALLERLSASG